MRSSSSLRAALLSQSCRGCPGQQSQSEAASWRMSWGLGSFARTIAWK
jgi:hypothetical protein